jgi:hypothetical protein
LVAKIVVGTFQPKFRREINQKQERKILFYSEKSEKNMILRFCLSQSVILFAISVQTFLGTGL